MATTSIPPALHDRERPDDEEMKVEKDTSLSHENPGPSDSESGDGESGKDNQAGVQQIEAAVSSWGKSSLITAYAL